MMEHCDQCGTRLTTRTNTEARPYHCTESGLPNVYLVGVEVFCCAKCELESAAIPNIDALHAHIAEGILAARLPIDGEAFRFLRKEARLTPTKLGECLNVQTDFIRRFEAEVRGGERPPIALRHDGREWSLTALQFIPCDRCGAPKTQTREGGGSLWHYCDQCAGAGRGDAEVAADSRSASS